MSDKYNQRWALLIAPGAATTNAVTLGQTTYYSEPQAVVDASPAWRRHEECHKRQWRHEGAIRFLAKYLWYQLRYGYTDNPYEVEARAAGRNDWG